MKPRTADLWHHYGRTRAGTDHAAYLATRHHPAQVVAVDASPAQHAMATDLYGRLAPRLRIVHSDVVNHLYATATTYDVLYSVFGAVDFTAPDTLLLPGHVPPQPNSPAPTGWHQTLSAVRKVVAIMSMAAFPAGTGPVWVK
jgi:hypothetical protein